jgi:hypothetical protein
LSILVEFRISDKNGFYLLSIVELPIYVAKGGSETVTIKIVIINDNIRTFFITTLFFLGKTLS